MAENQVKIFLPNRPTILKSLAGKLPAKVYLFGYLTRDLDCSKFFIVNYSTSKVQIPQSSTQLLGEIVYGDVQPINLTKSKNYISLSFCYRFEILQTVIDSQIITQSVYYQIINYNIDKFYNLGSINLRSKSNDKNDFLVLSKFVRMSHSKKEMPGKLGHFIVTYGLFIISLIASILKPFSFLFSKTHLYRHFVDFKKCLNINNFKDGSGWTTVFDILAGVGILAWLIYAEHPGKYLMDLTEMLVHNLRNLLEMLKGSPVGLKLNAQLNNFLLDCFVYHVDLWWNFLVIVNPLIHYIFLPMSVLGLFGLSFQLAMLSDLLTIITLHAHCFYIYAALLYKIEISGMRSLFRIVLGRRKNILRDRVESQEYTSRQLYLATLFFTILLFLLPTIIVYYAVFASLRFLFYCLTYILMTLQRLILTFPIYNYVRWLSGNYLTTNNLEMQTSDVQVHPNYKLIVLDIEPKPSKPWGHDIFAKQHDYKIKKPASPIQFLADLVSGKLMTFLVEGSEDST